MPETIARQTRVCRLDELNDPDSRGLTLCIDGQFYDIFIVCQGQQVFAYLNSCPHTGGPLDWVPDQFLSLDRDYIQCATHYALFRFNDGHCVAGPCDGERLTPVPLVITAGEIVIMHGSFPTGRL